METSNDVFISWSGNETGPVALALAKMIRVIFANQVRVFLSYDSIQSGEDWLGSLKAAIRCELVLCLLTPKNSGAPWINREVGMAIQAAEERGKPRLVPVLLGLCEEDIEPLFSRYQIVNCDQDGIRKVLHDVNQIRTMRIMPPEDLEYSFKMHWRQLGGDVEAAARRIAREAKIPDAPALIDDSPADLWKAHFEWSPSRRWRHCCLILKQPREAGRPGDDPDPNFYDLIIRHLIDGTRVTHVHFDLPFIAGFQDAILQDELVPEYVKGQLFQLLGQIIVPEHTFEEITDCVIFDIEYTSESRGYRLLKGEGGPGVVWAPLDTNELERRARILIPLLRELGELRRGNRAAYLRAD